MSVCIYAFTYTHTYICTHKLTDTSVFATNTYNIRGETDDSVSNTYNIRGETDDSVSNRYNIRGKTDDSVSNRYNIRGKTDDSVSNTYNIRGETDDSVSSSRCAWFNNLWYRAGGHLIPEITNTTSVPTHKKFRMC